MVGTPDRSRDPLSELVNFMGLVLAEALHLGLVSRRAGMAPKRTSLTHNHDADPPRNSLLASAGLASVDKRDSLS